ncbi:hypothetical protein MHU86_5116 [Fragilaria crotonensis]|nr:hypothetical protein MHU86_5116 [Fragilaria crotonensis]
MARGKFFNKRGGGPRFNAESAEEIEQRNNRLAELDEVRAERRADSDDEEGDGEPKEEGDDKVQGENPEGGEVAAKPAEDVPVEKFESRKEREAREKAENYLKRHQAGLTDEYKKDMEKLAEVRRRREEAAARKEMEQEAAELAEKERAAKAAQFASDSAAEEAAGKKAKKAAKNVVPKLDSITIKKMKPNEVKDALKERGLPIVGNKKDITARLLKFEAERTD